MRLYSALILLLICNPIQAEVHKWIDTEGNVHYAQTPPRNTKTTILSEPSKPASNPAPELVDEKSEVDNSHAQKEQQVEDRNTANLKKKQAVHNENCKIARQNLELYTLNSRVRVKEADGSYTRLSEEQRQERITDMQGKVKEFCSRDPVTLTDAETAKIIIDEKAVE